MRLPDATGLASCSQVTFRSQTSGVVFNIAGVLEVFSPALPWPNVLPGSNAPFVRLSTIFAGRVSFLFFESARVIRAVLMRSSNRLPLG